MKKTAVFFFGFVLLCTGILPAQQVTVAVSPFDSRSGISSGDADAVTELFMAELAVGGSVKVIDRAVFDKALRDMKFQAADWADPGKVIQLGRALKADSIIRGTVMALGGQPVITATVINAATGQPASPSTLRMAEIGEVFDKLPGFVKTLAPTLSGKPAPASIPAGFVRIQGGTFTMGSPASEAERSGDEVQHRVTLSGFLMGKNEVTVGEFRRFVNATGYKTTAETDGGGWGYKNGEWDYYSEFNWNNPGFSQTDNQPVTEVSWYDAIEYCNWLSRQENLTPAYTRNGNTVTWNRSANGYRLPTEAEWEYACRAGTTTPFSTGANITTTQANYDGNYPYNGNAKGTYREKTTPVGSFAANAWGLYDMHGNVWEWCWDWYGDYANVAQTDPMGAVSGADRVSRGGSWSIGGQYLRSACRSNDSPTGRYDILGIRLVRPVP